ncbi:MAG TPA: hypothetical protein VML55_04095, partial [Planctomycetaceae bacterium]|nr:hypothetical protein [Planctomycetaceae bacterium]
MNSTLTRWAGLILPAAVLVAGCSKPKPAEEIGLGSLAGKTYSHEYFNFRLAFPDDWYIMSEAEQKELMEAGKRAASSGNTGMEAALKAAETRTLSLVSAFEHPPGTPVPSNPTIIIMADRVAHAPGIKSGADYLTHMQTGLRQSAIPVQLQPIERNQQLGSLTMDALPVEIRGLQTVHQRHYAMRVNDYVLLI